MASIGRQRGHAWRDRAFFVGAAFVLSIAIFLGGGTQIALVSDATIQILALPLLIAALFRLMNGPWLPSWRAPILLMAAALVLALLQIVPLPPSIWTLLPGRAFAVDTYKAAGIPLPWLALSLAPHATLYSFFSMIPAAAVFLAALQLDASQRYRMLTVPLAIGAVGVMLGLAQLFGPDPESITFYRPANIGYAIGFFANRNHFPAMLYSLLPLAVAWTVMQVNSPSRFGAFWLYFGCGIVAAFLIGLSFSQSRAGVALGVVATFGAVIIVLRSLNLSRFGRWPIIIAAVGLIIFAGLLQLGLIDLLVRRSIVDNARSSIARLTLEALRGYYLIGSGFGTFVPVFKSVEAPEDLSYYFINHAHNDWLEVFLEGGIPAAILMALFVVWLLHRCFVIWFSRAFTQDAGGRLLALSASFSAVLLLLHSTLDYPLRTTALMSVFGACCAFLCPGPPEPEPVPRKGSSRSRSSRRSSH